MELFPEINKIDSELLNTYPVAAFGGEIVLIEDKESLDLAYSTLSSVEAIGFDTETKPNFKKGKRNRVALLQLSTNEKAFLLRVNKFGLPDQIVEILANPGIKKIGAATRDDIKVLRLIKDFIPGGFVDLQPIVKSIGVEQLGLRNIAAIFLGFKISKTQQLSNWENEDLNHPQKLYAATDAWVCLEIYQKIMSEGFFNDAMIVSK